MKLIRKLFGKKDATEKQIEKNNQSLKKRNIKRGVGAALGVGVGAYAGGILGGMAKGTAENVVYTKAANKALGKLTKATEHIVNKAKKGQLTEREAEFMRAVGQQAKKSKEQIKGELLSMVKKDKKVRETAEKVGKRAKLGVGLAVGGAIAAKTIADAVRISKDDKKRTESKNKKLKEESKNFSRLGDVSKRVTKRGLVAGRKFIRDFDRSDDDNLKSTYDALTNTPGSNDNKKELNLETLKKKVFSGHEKVSKELLKEAKKSGVIQKDSNGNWRIISIQAGEFWDAKYETREKAEAALAAYHANRH